MCFHKDETNLDSDERLARVGAGALLLGIAAAKKSPWLALLGLAPLLTGMAGRCPLKEAVEKAEGCRGGGGKRDWEGGEETGGGGREDGGEDPAKPCS